jgi:hypothetical protein
MNGMKSSRDHSINSHSSEALSAAGMGAFSMKKAKPQKISSSTNIASLSRIITIGAPFFTLVQRMHWIAMLGLGIVTVSILMGPKEWTWVVGFTAGLLEIVVGVPLAVVTAQELGRFSLFSLAPICCLILVAIMVWPGGLWQRWTQTNELSETGGRLRIQREGGV